MLLYMEVAAEVDLLAVTIKAVKEAMKTIVVAAEMRLVYGGFGRSHVEAPTSNIFTNTAACKWLLSTQSKLSSI